MMKHILTLSLVAVTLLFLASCDSVYTYEYRVKNITDTSSMQVRYHFKNDSTVNTITLAAGQEQLICVTNHGVEAMHGPYNKPVSHDIDSVIVIKNGIRSTKNMLLDDSWIFSVSHATGLYNATISDSEF